MPEESARLNSLFRMINVNDTIVEVRVVPIFAPKTMGTACCRVILPDATMATILAVTVELL